MSVSLTRFRPGRLLVQVMLIVVALVQLFPLVWLVMNSFKNNMELTGSNIIGFPTELRTANYEYVLAGTALARNFLNTMLYTVFTVAVAGLLSSMVSYAIARLKWKLSKVVLAVFMTGLMIPIHATLLPLFLMWQKAGILNSPLALLIPYVVSALPSTIFILTGFVSTIPREFEESGVVDGASIYQIFFKIILPLSKSSLVSVSIFTFLSIWNELLFANTFVSSEQLMTIQVAINSLRGVHFAEYGAIYAGLVLATLPAIVAYVLLSDQVQKGVIAGAIKG